MQGSTHPSPEDLRETIATRGARALSSGALQPIRTDEMILEDGGVRFVLRVASGLARKQEESARSAAKPKNPFLPYDEELFVAALSETHVCLLNKFNVIDRHLLIVTRAFEEQESLLTPEDFQALAVCMTAVGGLGFYNGGTAAGASQPHKHLQLVPLPLASAGPPVPIEALFAGEETALPFRHAFARIDRPPAGAAALHARYRALLDAVGLRAVQTEGATRQSASYNLLLTRDWMLLVPRAKERFEGISINALGFAGSLFVRDEAQRRLLQRRGPMAALRAVAVETP